MSAFAESLGRLYRAGRLRKDQLDALLSAGKVTGEEYETITKEADPHGR